MLAAYQKEEEEMCYKVYVSDVLRYAATAIGNLGGGKPELPRFYDIMRPQPEERRSPDEIVQRIKSKLKKS